MKKTLSMSLALVITSVLLSGCFNNGSSDKSTLKISGSTSMEKVSGALLEAYSGKNSKVTTDLQLGGSSSGVSNMLDGISDIGNASRSLKKEEIEKGAVAHVIGIDSIAVITHPSNTTKGLTTEQLADIYNGKITNWKEVGGNDQQIVVIGREASSGTRGAFEEILDIKDTVKYAQELAETGTVKSTVASTRAAIGYVSLDALDETVQALNFNSVKPSIETTKSGTYTLSRDFVMATKKELSGVAKDFFDFVYSEEGKSIIEKSGLVSVDKK
ncbi:MAG: phosphate ABC transporter substrate-binding protein [Oscillospiraceae bacterium]